MDQQIPPTQPMPAQNPTQAQTPASAPQVVQAAPPVKKSSSKKMLLALLMVIILALVLGALGYLYLQNKNLNNQTAQVPVKSNPTISPTPEVSVNNPNDLNKAINEVNSTNTSTMESEFNQAVTESKNL